MGHIYCVVDLLFRAKWGGEARIHRRRPSSALWKFFGSQGPRGLRALAQRAWSEDNISAHHADRFSMWPSQTTTSI
eukprot:2835286-Pyramimonas_sp.AAC.1